MLKKMIEMAEKNNLKPTIHKDHGIPMTRRQLISSGFLGFGASMVLPSFFGLLKSDAQAFAITCAEGGSSDYIPFLTVDMNGGSSIPGNFLATDEKGELLQSYDTLGWKPSDAGSLNTEFGIPMSAKYSKVLEGILQSTSAETRKNLRMSAIWHQGADDSNSNPLSALPLINRAGQRGNLIPAGLGTLSGSPTGTNSHDPIGDASLAPMYVGSIADISESLSYAAQLRAAGGLASTSLSQALKQLTDIQAARFAAHKDGERLATAAGCGQRLNEKLSKGEGITVDPRTSDIFTSVYGITKDTPVTDKQAVFAAVTMNALTGNTGPAAIDIADCDYHVGNQTQGDTRDLEAGLAIGRAVESAARLGKPLFFQLLTDGGVSSNPGSRNWTGEAGDRSGTIMGYFSPKGAPTMRRNQLGHYTQGQVAATNTVWGAGPRPSSASVAYGVLANYLNACGKLGEFETIAPAGIFGTLTLDEVITFEQVV